MSACSRARCGRILLQLLLLLAVAGCPQKTDPTPTIAVSPRAPERVKLIASKNPRTRAGAAPSRVHPMAAGQELGGPNVTGKVGDWVIENDEVVFVIDGLGGGAGFAESGGNVVDAADAKTRKDELGQLFTYFGAFPRQAVYTSIDAKMDADGTTALVEAKGKELYDPTLDVVTQYRLAAGDRALLITTTITNNGAARVTGFGLGDAIQWGGTEKVAPGKPLGFKGTSRGPFIGGVGRLASYAITSTEGEIAALNGGGWTDTEQKKDVAIDPGASVSYDRVFLVGERPDVVSLIAELTKASGGEVGLGTIEVQLIDSKGAPVKAPAGAKVIIGTGDALSIMSLVAAKDGQATFSGEIPPGNWVARFGESVGRRGDGTLVPATVRKNETTKISLHVTEPASVTLGPCEEVDPVKPGRKPLPIPCKLTIEGLKGTAKPEFGPPHTAALAKNVVILNAGETRPVPLPNGDYRVTASHGPEYDVMAFDLALPSSLSGAIPPKIMLPRVVDTAGYVSTDFHQHSILSADSAVALRDRVLANAAEGVEVAVASEHNVVADLSGIVKELALSNWLVEITGDELTSDASRKPFGHANVFPIAYQADKPRGGAPPVRDRLATDVLTDARALPGGPHILQINHPRSGKNGYFDQLKFNPTTGAGSEQGYDAQFDAIEVWNGRVVAHRTKVLEDYFALLRTSHVATPIADTDTHGIVGEEPGYPRTFVRLALKDDSTIGGSFDAKANEDLVKSIRETRDVVLSNGPFLKVTANGVPIGGVADAKATGGVVEVKVNVQTAPWVVVDKVEVRRARGGGGAVPAAVVLTPKKNPRGAMVADTSLTVRDVKDDDAIVVFVSGSTKPMRPVLSSAADDSEILPFAMSGPIWIDANGDGKSLGRTK